MNRPDEKRENAVLLRNQAEAELDRHPLAAAEVRPAEELLHELQVHRIELEMQKDELRQTQVALEESRDRYADLYEFAPVGYLTLNANGLIEEINLTAVRLLGTERKHLVQRSFAALVLAEDRSRWAAMFMRLKAGVDKGSVELALQRGDGTVFQVLLDCERRLIPGVGAGSFCVPGNPLPGQVTAIRIVLTDISRRKAAEAVQGQQTEDLKRFNHAMVDREMAMIELKRQVNALSRELGRAPPFALDFADAPGGGAPQ